MEWFACSKLAGLQTRLWTFPYIVLAYAKNARAHISLSGWYSCQCQFFGTALYFYFFPVCPFWELEWVLDLGNKLSLFLLLPVFLFVPSWCILYAMFGYRLATVPIRSSVGQAGSQVWSQTRLQLCLSVTIPLPGPCQSISDFLTVCMESIGLCLAVAILSSQSMQYSIPLLP